MTSAGEAAAAGGARMLLRRRVSARLATTAAAATATTITTSAPAAGVRKPKSQPRVKAEAQGQKREPAAAATAKDDDGSSAKAQVPSVSKGKRRLSNDHAGREEIFADFSRPTHEQVYAVLEALYGLYGVPHREDRKKSSGRRGCVLDFVVGTILSQNTTDVNSSRAFASLKDAYPSWEAVRTADAGDVADSIRCGGLADIKASRIQHLLRVIHEERGACSLEHYEQMSNEDIKRDLARFKGIGPKTVACVLMFGLQRAEFPVDTHVWKLAVALGWVPPRADRDETYFHLNRRTPDHVKYDLHVLLVEHGKKTRNDPKLLRKAMEERERKAGEAKDGAAVGSKPSPGRHSRGAGQMLLEKMDEGASITEGAEHAEKRRKKKLKQER